ncbi:unnamed protein product [Macrosiphum euphorbiae]|uniref:N-acetyltransferase domain-containing protein n=1 Tax=Macrosiphum euphorbiae TaxID=13131 RepID=A0AAV0XIU7_9HEMI|nr:unnamed protein product [Macrosiphum euphorbiae]
MENSFPQIWKIIDIPHCGQMKKFIFQEIPEHYYDEIINKYAHEFFSEEIIYRTCNFLNDPVSLLDMENKYRKYLAQKMSIGVFEYIENDENKLVGLNLLFRMNNKSMNSMQSISTYYEQINNYLQTVFKSYAEQLIGNKDYLASDMLFVRKDYRNIGLALQLLELRNYVGKKYNLKYTISLFTSNTAQKLAEKVGFTGNRVYNCNDAVDNEKNFLFPLLKDKSGTCMIKYIS